MNQELVKSIDEIKTLIKKKDFQIAFIKINKLIKFHPTYLYLYGLRGEILFLKKRYDDAYDDLIKRIEDKTLRIRALSILGLVKTKKGDLQEAQEIYEKILMEDKNNTSAHNNLGNIYSKLGKEALSIDRYKKVLQIDTRHIGALKNLARMYQKQTDLKQATSTYKHVLEINPKDTDRA